MDELVEVTENDEFVGRCRGPDGVDHEVDLRRATLGVDDDR